ncbi:MAG TPA: IPT/TIG domain-containing protein [Pyrinomonadaceae bacterium]|nr:IPT/TIG domain-containing protein [Pyrinomonadaceae bacterium]
MPVVDLTKPGEKKKLIAAAVLGLVAILFLWWTFIGFGSSNTRTATRPQPSPTPQRGGNRPADNTPRPNDPAAAAVIALSAFQEIDYQPSSYNAPEARRNIFAYYEPPVKVPTPKPEQPTPVPSPPPILVASVSPANAYARSGDFKLEVAGDKFTGATRIYIDGRELPTTFISPQQLSTTVPSSIIASPGARQIEVRTPDNQLYSNKVVLSVAAPPIPNYTYVGIISPITRVGDTALVQDKANKSIIGVQRGDLLSNRFRVTSISDKELVLMDATLKIQHKLAMTEGDKSLSSPLSRPTPRVDAEDDEP